MKVLVTGGNGYLGNVLVRKLLKKGYDVNVIDNFMYGNNLLPVVSNLQIFHGDIGNFKQLANAFAGCDVAINLAAIVGPEACDVNPDLAVLTNQEALKNFVKLHPKKLIHTSTCSIYGFYEKKILTEEDAILTKPVSLYGNSKLASEPIVREGIEDHVIFRHGTLYGYSKRMRYDLVVNIFIAKALNNEKLTVFGGDQKRPLMHISDAANAYIHAIENNLVGTYNTVFKNYSILEIAEKIAQKFGVEIEINPNKTDIRSTLVSNEKLVKSGYEPKVDILDPTMIDRIKKSDTWKDYKNPIYSNLELIKRLKL